MRILLLGWYYSSNLGDAVICDCVADTLRRQYPQAEILLRDMAGRTRFPPRRPVTMASLRRDRRRVRLRSAATTLGWDKQEKHSQWYVDYKKEVLEQIGSIPCDAVVFAGGQLFMDDLALLVEKLTALFAKQGIPVFFNACGVGPSRSHAIQTRLGAALRDPMVKLVSCRDDAALAARWRGMDVIPTADPALEAAALYGIRRDEGSRVLGLGIQYPYHLNVRLVKNFWRRLILDLEAKQIPWKLFTNGGEADMAFARDILASLKLPERCLCPAPETPAALVKTIARFGGLISFRLHSHILACSLDIPTAALVWDRKIPLFFEKIGCPERCLTPDATPAQTLAVLALAAEKGYDRDLLARQSREARALLLEALAHTLPGKERQP